nr:strigolactone esterase D14-like [Ipomoea batatas]GME09178.1 strigolactone esterase D14-like [Ipomoea batatas]
MVMQKGLSMNARIVGSGKQTIVLAHGYGADQTVWEKVVPKLGERYQLLLFDWCFSGAIKDRSLFDAVKYSCYEAFADDMIGLLDELNLKSCVFLGHSMSGMIGCIASVKRPDLFTKLILVASSPRFINLEDYEGGFDKSYIDEMFADMETNYEQWCSAFAAMVVDPSDPPSVEKFAKSLKRMGVEIGLPLAKTVFLSDHRSVLDKVVAPVTLVHTNHDLVVPAPVVAFMHGRINESTVEIVNTDGHFPQLTAHEEFLEVVFAALG